MTEFELIDLFTAAAPRGGRGVVLGIGDDAALLRPPRGEQLVATVDAVVEGVHFDRRFRPEDIGWKALAVNLSDLAAMGARPLWALCALAVPPGASPARLAGVGRGLADCARAHATALVGGNVTAARELALTVTLVGAVRPGRAITRAGARPGDRILVSGTVGDAALALQLEGLRAAPGDRHALTARQRRPAPRVALGRALAGLASAGLDLSDGLLQDLGHLCRASRVAARIDAAALPLGAAYRRVAARASRPLEAALAGGEDYELLVTVPPRRLARARAAARRVGVPLAEVGEVMVGRGVRVTGAGALPTGGYDHLRART